MYLKEVIITTQAESDWLKPFQEIEDMTLDELERLEKLELAFTDITQLTYFLHIHLDFLEEPQQPSNIVVSDF